MFLIWFHRDCAKFSLSRKESYDGGPDPRFTLNVILGLLALLLIDFMETGTCLRPAVFLSLQPRQADTL